MVNLANGFVSLGYEVDMVLLNANGPLLTDLSCKVRIIDLHALRIRKALLPLCRYLRHNRPSVLIANMWPLTVVSLWARALAHVATCMVVVEHTTWSRDEYTRSSWGRMILSFSMRFIYRTAEAIVTVSKGAADDLARVAKLDRNTITVIYNPIVGDPKPSASKPLAPLEWWTGTHRKVLAVGTLKPIKDYSTLLKAFAELLKRVDARLLILGEGECRTMIDAQVRQLGIEAHVFLPGYIANPSPYYQQADLHVLSSTGEGFGNVLVEALEVGTPIVSTDCPSGPREILSDGQFGHLVPVGDPAAMAAAMAESLAGMHDTAALRARAQDFAIGKAVCQYEKLLFQLSKKSLPVKTE